MRVTAFLTFILAGVAGPMAAKDCSDVDLVLALDASGSIDNAEYDLQKSGYALALTDPAVLRAIKEAGNVDVAVLQWGDPNAPTLVLEWRRIADVSDAEEFAWQIKAMPRGTSGNTGTGRGLDVALAMLDAPDRCGFRKIINLSGDGRESLGPRAPHHVPLVDVRHRAEREGITINALAIAADEPDLALWFQKNVITGPGSFVMQVNGFDEFADAIVRKLVREITPAKLAGLADAAVLSPDTTK